MRRYRARKRAQGAAAALPDVPATGSAQADKLATWAREALVVPPGHPAAGEPMALPAFAVDWLAGALGAREALLSMARKNAKSAICAVAALGYLVGPLRTVGWRGAVASLSKEKANELRAQVEAIALASKLDGLKFRRSPYPGKVFSETGQLEILSADRSAGHASSFDLVIADELGLFPARARELMAGLRSSLSAKDGRLWAISVQGDSELLQEMIGRSRLPGTHVQVYAAADGCDLADKRAWEAANPGLGTIKSSAYMADAARRAAATPADQAEYRAYDLNQRLDPEAQTIVTLADWLACQVPELPAPDGPCYLGVDLGGARSMTAAVAMWANGRTQCWGAFPELPALKARGRADGCAGAYETMHAQSQLRIYGHRTTDVGAFLASVFDEIGGTVAALGCDRYRHSELQEALFQAGIRVNVQLRGTGAGAKADGAYDVRSFQRYVARRELAAVPCKMWHLGLRNAVLRFDAAGNPALDKAGPHRRMDVVSAAVIAAGLRRKFAPVHGRPLQVSVVG